MAKWRKTCKEFKIVREMIDDGDINGIMKALGNICGKYANGFDIFADDFRELAEEIADAEVETEDDCDYYLGAFYDLCDSAGIWLDL